MNIQRMLALTKAALFETIPDKNLFINIGEADWNDLFELSALQGVMALSLNGAMGLPKDLQPPLPVKFRWIASVEAVEKRYRHYRETAQKLSAQLKENNIRMLLFKGLALSRLYPVPASREFGDIDIFLYGKAKEGDELLKRITGEETRSLKKHSKFSYRGISIENHYNFLEQNNRKSFLHRKNLEEQLTKIVTESACVTNESLLFPPPDFDALHGILHTLSHLSSKIVLRQLCDLTVIFTVYKGKIDFSSFRNSLSEAGLLKLADSLISLSVRYLGLNPECVPPYESDVSLENRIWNEMLNPEVTPLPKEKRTLFNVFIYKIRLLRSNRWKNELLFPGRSGITIFYSVFYHLLHPKSIRKIK